MPSVPRAGAQHHSQALGRWGEAEGGGSAPALPGDRFAIVTNSSFLFVCFFPFVAGLFSLQRNAYNHQEISQGKEK